MRPALKMGQFLKCKISLDFFAENLRVLWDWGSSAATLTLGGVLADFQVSLTRATET